MTSYYISVFKAVDVISRIFREPKLTIRASMKERTQFYRIYFARRHAVMYWRARARARARCVAERRITKRDKLPPEVEILGRRAKMHRTPPYIHFANSANRIKRRGGLARPLDAGSHADAFRGKRDRPAAVYLYLRASARGMTDFSKKRWKRPPRRGEGAFARIRFFAFDLVHAAGNGNAAEYSRGKRCPPREPIVIGIVCPQWSFSFHRLPDYTWQYFRLVTSNRSISFGYSFFWRHQLNVGAVATQSPSENVVSAFRIADMSPPRTLLSTNFRYFNISNWNLENAVPLINSKKSIIGTWSYIVKLYREATIWSCVPWTELFSQNADVIKYRN